MKKLVLISSLIFLSSFASVLMGQTIVPSTVSTNQTWDKAGSPYILTGTTRITSSTRILIKPGAKIKRGVSAPFSVVLQVDGEIHALGNKDSLISFDSIEIQTSNGTIDFDSSTGLGTQFSFCHFTGNDNNTLLNLDSTSVKISNSIFNKFRYGIWAKGVYDHLIIDSCIFDNNDAKTSSWGGETLVGSALSIQHKNSASMKPLHVTNSGFYNLSLITVKGQTLFFEKNKVDNINRFDITTPQSASKMCQITCNKFNRFHSITFDVSKYGVGSNIPGSLLFKNNTLDSSMLSDGKNATLPMVKLGVHDKEFGQTLNLAFTNNNFLYSTYKHKFEASGWNANNLARYDTLNLTNNYWGTADSSKIDSLISDRINDNYEVVFDYIPFDTGQIKIDCSSPPPSSCKASFYKSIDTLIPFTIFVINDSKGTTGGTQYHWDFGDGTTSNKKTPKHVYTHFGMYQLCLSLFDSSRNCKSIFCDSIGMDSTGKPSKPGAFTINILNEKDLLSIHSGNQKAKLSVYPNPNSGHAKIDVSSINLKDAKLTIINAIGATIQEIDLDKMSSHTTLNLDIQDFSNGMYFLCLKNPEGIWEAKLHLIRE